MLANGKRKPSFKIWLEYKGKPILGKGGAEILEQIEKGKSISGTARRLGMSYRYVWNYLRQIEKNVGKSVVETFRGGKAGGGGAHLTEFGKGLLGDYKRVESYVDGVLTDAEYPKAIGLKINARNRLKGRIMAMEKKGATIKVKVEIMVPAIVTALVSRKTIEDLGIEVGNEVEAVVKTTEVLVAKE